MNSMNDNTLKLIAGIVLFGTWVTLVVCKVQNANDLISCIKDALIGLGLYHMGGAVATKQTAAPFSSSKY